MNDLMQGVLGGSDFEGSNRIHLEAFDGEKVSPETLLYNSQSAGENERPPASALVLQTSVESAGRLWTLCFTQGGNLASAVDYGKVWLVFFAGTSVSLLLFGLSLALLNTQFKAWKIATKLTAEYKRVGDTLRESEERHRVLFDQSRDAMMTMAAPSWQFTTGNPATLALFGVKTANEFLALGPWDISPERQPDGRPSNEKAQEMIETALHEGSHFFEWMHQRLDGVTIPCTVLLTRMSMAGQVFVQATVRDITEHKQAETIRQEALNRLQKIASRVPGLVYQYRLRPDGNACMPFASEAIRELFRVSPEDVHEDLSKLFANIHPDDYVDVGVTIQKSARDLTPWQHGFRVKFDDGTIRSLYGNAVPQREEDGSVLWHGFVTDITERILAETALREDRQRLAGIIKGTNVGTWEWNVQTGETIFNNRWAEIIGYTLEEISPVSIETWMEFSHPDDFNASNELLKKHFCGELGYYEFESRMKHKDGNWVWVLDRGKVTTWMEDGKPLLMQGTHQDITERKRAEVVLREEQDYTQNIIGSMADMLVVVAPDGTIATINQATCQSLGYPERELIGQPATLLFQEEEEEEEEDTNFILSQHPLPVKRTVLRRLVRVGSVSNVEKSLRTKTGDRIPVLLSGAIMRNDRNEIRGIVCLASDITKRKEMERRQNLSVEIMGILNDPVALSDAINRILAAIQQATGFDAVGIRLRNGDDFPYYSQNGFSSDFLLAENTLIVRGQDGGPCRDKNGNLSMECTCGLVLSGQADLTLPFFTPGGSFWTNDSLPLLDLPSDQEPRLHPRNRCIHEGFCSVALIPIRTNQEIVGLLQFNDRKKDCFTLETVRFFEGISSSIGMALMRKQAETALRESETRMRAITDSAQDAILMIDTDGRVSYWNPAAERIFGYTSAEAIGQNLHQFIVPQRYHVAHHAAFPEFRRTGHGSAVGKTLDLEARRKDGKEISVQLSLSAIQIHGDWHAVGILRDITEQKRAKEQIGQYAADLESSNQALKESNQIAESATRAKSEFLANMSHEIRTPMTAILGYADILLEESVGRASCEHVKVIKRNGEHLLGLINDILDLSKVEAGKMQIEPICCSPFDLLAEVASLMRVRATAKQLRLEMEQVSPLPETIITDPLRLRQVLINLVGNAIKFTDQGEIRIAVRLTDDNGHVCLRFDVTDTGIGMNEDQLGGLFRAFSQVDNSSARKFGGTGLGLCISKRLAEAMGGKIEVQSTPGKGSTFSVTIDPGPLDGIRMIQNSQEALLEHPPTPTAATPDEIKLSGRILLAEDGPDNQRLIAFVLKKAGAEVTLAENGQIAHDEAKAALAQGTPFDVILMDMQMPVMDGYEATRSLRSEGYIGPIIALTAHAMTEDRKKCIDAGCDDFGTKPINRQVLLTTVAHWMAPGRTTELPKPAAAPAASESNTISAMPSTFIYSQMAADPDFGELVDLFVQEMPDRINALETQAQSRDWQELTRTAHQMKGAAGSYGFGEITPSAARLEAAARNGSQEEEILSTLDELLSLCRQVRSGVPQAEVEHCPNQRSESP